MAFRLIAKRSDQVWLSIRASLIFVAALALLLPVPLAILLTFGLLRDVIPTTADKIELIMFRAAILVGYIFSLVRLFVVTWAISAIVFGFVARRLPLKYALLAAFGAIFVLATLLRAIVMPIFGIHFPPDGGPL